MEKVFKRKFERIQVREDEGMISSIFIDQQEFIGHIVDISFGGIRSCFEPTKKPSVKLNQEFTAKLDLSGYIMEADMRVAIQETDWIGFEFMDLQDVDRESLAYLMQSKLIGSKLESTREVTKDPKTGYDIYRYHGSDECVFLWLQPTPQKVMHFQCIIGEKILEWKDGKFKTGLLTSQINESIVEQGCVPSTSIALSQDLELKLVWFVKSLLYASPLPEDLKCSIGEMWK